MPYKEKYTKVLPGGFISFGGPAAEGATEFESLFDASVEMDLDGLPPAAEAGNDIPRTPTGKILKRKLRETLETL